METTTQKQLLLQLKSNEKTPEYVVQQLCPRSIRQILTTPCPPLCEIEKDALAILYIQLALVIYGVNVIDVAYSLSKPAVIDCSKIIYRNFPEITLEDIILCLEYGKLGKFGQLYNTLNSTIILNWLQCYWARRTEVKTAIELEQMYDLTLED